MRALVKIIEVTAISAMLSPVAPYWKSMWNKRSRLEVNSFIHSQLHKNAQEVWINIPLNLLMNWLLRYKLLLIKALNESIWRRSWKSINTMVVYSLRRSREIEALVVEKFKESAYDVDGWDKSTVSVEPCSVSDSATFATCSTNCSPLFYFSVSIFKSFSIVDWLWLQVAKVQLWQLKNRVNFC